MLQRRFIWLAVLLLGCAGGVHHPPTPEQSDSPWHQWQSQVLLDHPLVGRVWDPRRGEFIGYDQIGFRAQASDYLLIGEKHDNVDHHRIQAWLIDRVKEVDRRPAVVFEMLPLDKRDVVYQHRREHETDVDAFAEAVGWAASGWPSWNLYRPVFATALADRLPVEPGDLPRATLREMRTKGLDFLDSQELLRLGLDEELESATRELFAAAIRESHCGMAKESTVDRMIAMQRTRDAYLADSLLETGTDTGAVLIAGAGHVLRAAVPAFLRRRAPQRSVLAIGLLEVDDERLTAGEYLEVSERPEFDLLWFTPRTDNEDPCERYRDHLKRLGK